MLVFSRASRRTLSLFLVCFLLVVGSVVGGARSAHGQTTVFTESFDDASQFAVTAGSLTQDGTESGSATNYFLLAQNATPGIDKSYDGSGSNFLAGQDMDDDEVSSDPGQLEWTGIDISGKGGLEFSGRFGEVLDADQGVDDNDDYLLIEYRIDDGGYQNLIRFAGDGTNGAFREDTDFDGTGDGEVISSANGSLESFTKAISGTGSRLDLRFTASVDAGDEDFAVDDFSVTASPAVQFTVGTGTVGEEDGSTRLLVEILSPPSGTSVSSDVVFTSSKSSAAAGDVNSFGTKSVTFPSGVSSGATRSVTVDIAADGQAEGSETAVFSLQNPSGGGVVVGSPDQFDLTIKDAPSDHAGDVLITELSPNPGGSDEGKEYVELYNATGSDITLDGWTLVDQNADEDQLDGVTVPARGFVVLCEDADPVDNGGIENCALDYVNDITLNNSGDTIILRDDTGTEVDRVEYDGGSKWPDPDGQAMVFTGTTNNNVGSNWTTATRRERGFTLNESGDDGSPGRGGAKQTLQPSADITGSGGWRLLSAPMGQVSPDTLAQLNLVQGIAGHYPGAEANLYQWPGGPTNSVSWTPPSSGTTDLTSGASGFLWYIFGSAKTSKTDPPPFTLSLPGSPRTASVTTAGLGGGFYLLGNPFAQTYDLSDLDLSGNDFSTTVQIWDPSAGSFQLVTQSSGSDDLIGPYQGFFVERSTGTSTKTLTLSPNGRRADPTPLKSSSEGPTRIAFRLRGTANDTVQTRDEALTLLAHPEASMEWDAYDASKLTPLASQYVTAAFVGHRGGRETPQAVASVPRSLPRDTVRLPIQIRTAGLSTLDRAVLSWPSWLAVPEAWSLLLRDTKRDSTVNLRRHSNYTFRLSGTSESATQSSRLDSENGSVESSVPPAPPSGVAMKASDASPRFSLLLTTSDIPVEMTGLSVVTTERRAVIEWATATEINNAGFYIEHRAPDAETFATVGFVNGAGSTERRTEYRFETDPLPAGRNAFRLRQVDTDGRHSVSETVSVDVRLQDPVQLRVHPNPVRRATTLKCRVRVEQDVHIALYDALGRRVRRVFRGRVGPEGTVTRRLSTSELASGIYFLRAGGERFVETRRIVVLR